MWWNDSSAKITNVRLVTSNASESTTTTTVTTTEPPKVTTTPTTTTSVPETVTTKVTTTTTPKVTTTTSSSNSKYIPVTLKDSIVNVDDYTSKKIVGVTFKLTGSSSGNGACQLMASEHDWLGSVDYSFTDTDTITIDLSKYSNIKIIKLYVWWNTNNESISDVQLITE